MKAGSVILVPGGVSQAVACEGIFYKIPAGNNVPNPPPGVMPIETITDLGDSRLQTIRYIIQVYFISTMKDPRLVLLQKTFLFNLLATRLVSHF